jgi:hypothetical protein
MGHGLVNYIHMRSIVYFLNWPSTFIRPYRIASTQSKQHPCELFWQITSNRGRHKRNRSIFIILRWHAYRYKFCLYFYYFGVLICMHSSAAGSASRTIQILIYPTFNLERMFESFFFFGENVCVYIIKSK